MSASGGDDEFSTGAALSIRIDKSSLSAARQQIERELSDIPVGIDAEVSGGRGAVGSKGPEPASIDLARRQLGHLEVLEELAIERNRFLDDGGGGGGGGLLTGGLGFGLGRTVGGGVGAAAGGAGAGAGGGLGLTALGIGGGIGLGALGIGAGAGLATGNIQLPEDFKVDLGGVDITPTLEGPFIDAPDIPDPLFETPLVEAGLVESPVVEEGAVVGVAKGAVVVEEGAVAGVAEGAIEGPLVDGPLVDFPETIGANLDVDTDLVANINANPDFTFAPTVNLTGIDLGSLADDVEDAITSSQQFQNEVENIAGNVVDDVVDVIERQTGLNLNI